MTSPLGVWLLLAVAAPATIGPVRAALERVLGCDAEDACARAGALLSAPHPAVATAAAIWSRPAFLDPSFSAFGAAVPKHVQLGPVPTQDAVDQWAAAHTNGMIPTFPITISPLTAFVLATAIATDVSWETPFATAPAAQLGGEFAETISVALESASDHDQFIASTTAAGVVAVHAVDAASGLKVISVLASATTAPDDVHRGAHEVAAMLSDTPTSARRISLFDLPLGDGDGWTIVETEEARYDGPGRIETFSTLLPAWSAEAEHDILSAPGVPELCETFGTYVLDQFLPADFEAKQSAVAAYTRTGFKAAAVTAFGMMAGSAMAERATVTRRHALFTFNRAYAVIAVATNRIVASADRSSDSGALAWSGVPVFNAWVTEPAETVDANPLNQS